MKDKKSLYWLSAGLGLGLFVLYRQRQEQKAEKAKQQLIADVRSYFSQKGPIQVVYVNTYDKSDEATTGGVVLEDGRRFEFTYFEGEILSTELDHD